MVARLISLILRSTPLLALAVLIQSAKASQNARSGSKTVGDTVAPACAAVTDVAEDDPGPAL